jgi:hypothetical protein
MPNEKTRSNYATGGWCRLRKSCANWSKLACAVCFKCDGYKAKGQRHSDEQDCIVRITRRRGIDMSKKAKQTDQ